MKDAIDMTVLLDRSGSMASIKAETESGFAFFLNEQKKQPGEAKLTLVQFDTEYEQVYSAKNLADVSSLNLQPRGCTALHDSLAKAIVDTGERLKGIPEVDRPAKVLFIVITDGLENSSREHTKESVRKMIEHQTSAYQWQFIYLGANQDAFAEAGSLGISVMNAMTYAPTEGAVKVMYSNLADNVARYRSGGSRVASFTDSERSTQKKAN